MKNDVMTTWKGAYYRLSINMSSRRATLVARSCWLSEPEMSSICLGWLDYRRRVPPKTEWDVMQRAALEADVDLLDDRAFAAFRDAWCAEHDRRLVPSPLKRWAASGRDSDD